MHRDEELIAVFDWERQVFQNEDPERRTVIGDLEDGRVVKGRARRGALQCGLTYRFLGHWVEHPKYGRQFHFSSATLATPIGERATVKYLQRGPGIGSARAQRIWNLFREGSLDVVRTDPVRIAAEIEGMTLEKAEAAAEHFRAHQRLEKVTIEVQDLIGSRGFPRSLPDKVIRQWGEDAPRIIRDNPYQLMRFTGAGFARADALYLELGHDPAAVQRQGYCLWHALASDGNGHTWHCWEDGRRALCRSIAGDQVRMDAALDWATTHELLTERIEQQSNRHWLAEAPKAWAETRIARHVTQAQRETFVTPPRWPELGKSNGTS